ncbi:MAG TPA: leucine-rich repeat domain-containing protein, partial [Flavobacterium sp.]|nr:leucine-rich repeat domain-containing protein [Flavobacterium sp.]
MKKIILVLGLLFCIQMQATIITFPDANFKSVLIGTSSTSYTAKDSAGNPLVIDANGDNEIEDTEALNVYTLYIGAAGITDATGLEYFTNIEDLDIDHNSLTNMNDILWALQNLKFLNLGYNQIVYIDLNLHPTIEVVSLYNNSLTFFRMTQCPNLKSIDVYQNLISTFDFGSNPLLENVEFSYNNVSYISAFDLPSLKTIQGVHNNLSNFMLFDVPVIETINLRWNQFTSFPSISGDFSSLKELYLSNNPNLTSIALTGLVNLRTLHCNSGQLAMLDASNLPNLTHLECNNNLLTSLILTGSPVSYLDASNNLLGGSGIVWRTNSSNSVSSSLSISNISSLTYFDCSDNQLTSLNLVGANSLGYFDSRNNPSLATIFVDDVAVANANTSWFKDAATTYVAASSPPVANDDQKTVCYVYPRLDNFDITINDVDANGNPVDASTVDLDPSTPEQDTSFTVNGATFYVDNFGKLFVLSDLYGNNQLSYTVKDFSGTTSNIATINLYMQIDITVEDEDFSATPINGTVGGITISVLDNDYGSFGTSSNLNAFDFTFNSYFSINSLGFITVNPGTPAGVYIFTYEVKEFSLDTQFCPGRLGQATILVLGAPPTANFDGIIVCSQPGNLISYPLTANDLDANSNPVDATTVDLDPSTPEQDTSITVNSLTFSVDSSGVLTTNMPGLGNYGFFYTVKDSNGTLSNIANVSLYFQPNVLVTNDDFSATPINGATGGVTSSVLDNDFVVGGSMIPLTAQDNFYNLGSSFTISSTGYITIPAGTPVGVYTFNYEVKLAESATAYCPGRMSQATIVVTGGTPPTANSDLPVVCPNVFGGASYGLLNYNVVANDYDSSSNPVDASTVDLDPSTSGQQTSVMVSGATFSVNAFGDVTSDIGLIGSHTIFYT